MGVHVKITVRQDKHMSKWCVGRDRAKEADALGLGQVTLL